PQSRHCAHLGILRYRCEEVADRAVARGRSTRRHSDRYRFRRRRYHAHDHCGRRVVAARPRSGFRSGLGCTDLHGYHATHVAKPSSFVPQRRSERGGAPMNGSRITAVGLVAAAALWIASGHFMPHETAESRAAIRTDTTGACKLVRVAVMETNEVMHARKLTISGRTEADKRVMVTARTGGVLTELRVKRGTWVKEGDVIAVLSDDARAAQVLQAKALVVQRRAEL